jgi:predicted Zn-dependent peptidase
VSASLHVPIRTVFSVRIRTACAVAMTAVLLPWTAALAARPKAPEPAELPLPALFDRVEEFRLPNGMHFLLLPRHDVPTVSGRIRFRVGNVDCPAGRSGIAHMFEHMAFQGTEVIGCRDRDREAAIGDSIRTVGLALSTEILRRQQADTTRIRELRAELERLNEAQSEATIPNEFSRLYDQYTYYFNAWTSPDFTNYETDVPSNALEIWMLMESERIQHPSFRGFYKERDVVMEERRQGEDDPTTMAWELMGGTVYQAHPYRLPVIGYMSDLQTLTQQDAEAFRKIYYVPGNAVGSLVGDFDPAEAKRLITEYFGDIPAGPPPPEINTEEPPQRGMRRAILRQGTEDEIYVVFPGFAPTDRRSVVQTLLADVLSRDITSRLDRRLDIKEKAAREVWASAGYPGRYPGTLVLHAKPLEGFTTDDLERMIWEELAGVVSHPVTKERLDEIRASRRKRFYRGLVENSALADRLVESQMVYGSWRAGFERIRLADTVTVDEITEMARDLCTPDHASVILVHPAEKAEAMPGGNQ